MNTDRSSEGPYRIRNDREEDVFISGPGLFESGEFPSGNFEYDQICAGLNTAYAEGKKAERERCLAIVGRHPGKCDETTPFDCLQEIKYEIGGQDGK